MIHLLDAALFILMVALLVCAISTNRWIAKSESEMKKIKGKVGYE